MNLAEIRKKAEGAKKTVPPAPPAPILEAEPPADGMIADAYELELEEFIAEADRLAAAIAAEEDALLPEPVSWQEEPLPAAEPQAVVVAADPGARPAVVSTPHTETLPLAPTRETAAVHTPLTGASQQRSVYNPLATILAGREESVDPDEASAFQQQSFSAADVEEYLCFRVASEEYALSIMAIKEIIKPRVVTEVPRMPNFISGVISLRGVIIPVMDMRLRLSLSVTERSGRERIIVLRADTGFCGLLVDEVVQVARIRKSDIEEPPAVLDGIDRDFVRGLGHFDNRMLILLNLETIIDISIH